MTVQNISQFHDYSVQDLDKLTTQHLKHILESARGRITCGCGKGHHCGDDSLAQDERDFNTAQAALEQRVKPVLTQRGNIVSTKQVKKKEKKVMAY